MAHSASIPAQIAGYTAFSLTLPPLPSFPTAATHYLYVAPHRPKIPSATAPRSVFLVNIPFDSTEAHIKHLLSTQIGLPAGRIEDVQFESQRRKFGLAESEELAKPNHAKKGRKRKRGSEIVSLENTREAPLPSTWDRDLQTNGLTAVILFVDRASMDAALKAIKVSQKERKKVVWGEGMKADVPALGSASESALPAKFMAC